MIRNKAINGFPFNLRSLTDGSAINTGAVVGYSLIDGVAGLLENTPVAKGNSRWVINILAPETDGIAVGFVFIHSISNGFAGFTFLTNDFWAEVVPGTHPSGTAGFILGNDIASLVSALAKAVVQTSSPVLQDAIELTRGDEYDGIGQPKRTITVAHSLDLTANGTTVDFSVRENDSDDLVFTQSGVIVSLGGGQYRADFIVLNSKTKLLPPNVACKYDVQFLVAGTSRWTPAIGTVVVKADKTLT